MTVDRKLMYLTLKFYLRKKRIYSPLCYKTTLKSTTTLMVINKNLIAYKHFAQKIKKILCFHYFLKEDLKFLRNIDRNMKMFAA